MRGGRTGIRSTGARRRPIEGATITPTITATVSTPALTPAVVTPPLLKRTDLPLGPGASLLIGPPQLMGDEEQQHEPEGHGHLGTTPQHPPHDPPPARGATLHNDRHPRTPPRPDPDHQRHPLISRPQPRTINTPP